MSKRVIEDSPEFFSAPPSSPDVLNKTWMDKIREEAEWFLSEEYLNEGSCSQPSQAAIFNPVQICEEDLSYLNLSEGVVADDRATKVSKSTNSSKFHKDTEQRRRDRMAAQFAKLRELIPGSERMFKATLLAKVVDRIKDLKQKASESSESLTIVPSEVDEVIADYEDPKPNQGNDGVILIRVSICLDDRPELLSELTQVFKRLKLTVVKSDMASVGGRFKIVLILRSHTGNEGDEDQGACLNSLRQSLKMVAAFSSIAANRYDKRQRPFLP